MVKLKGMIKLSIEGNELKSCEIELEVDSVEQLTDILRVLGIMAGSTTK